MALNEAREYPREVNEIYRGRRNALCDGLARIGWDVPRPQGTMFVWARDPEPYRDLGSLEFALRLAREAHVAVSPGDGFGPGGEGHVRFALVENEHRIRQAVRGIRSALDLAMPSAKLTVTVASMRCVPGSIVGCVLAATAARFGRPASAHAGLDDRRHLAERDTAGGREGLRLRPRVRDRVAQRVPVQLRLVAGAERRAGDGVRAGGHGRVDHGAGTVEGAERDGDGRLSPV